MRQRNLYRIDYWSHHYMDSERREHIDSEYIETWGEEKAREIFRARHPLRVRRQRGEKDNDIDKVVLLVEDI